MKHVVLCFACLTALSSAPGQVKAISLDEACGRFAAKLQAALAAGSTSQAKAIYSKGSQRIAAHFNGATCPNVKAP